MRKGEGTTKGAIVGDDFPDEDTISSRRVG
jgi:hypothetical protein